MPRTIRTRLLVPQCESGSLACHESVVVLFFSAILDRWRPEARGRPPLGQPLPRPQPITDKTGVSISAVTTRVLERDKCEGRVRRDSLASPDDVSEGASCPGVDDVTIMCAPSQGAMLPYSLKIPSPYFPFGPPGAALNQAHLSALDFQRSQLNDYNVRVQLGFRNYQNSLGLSPFHSYITDPYSQAFFYKHDPRARFVQEEPKPSHSYIGLIAMAILSSKEKKLVLSDIYQWILDNYPYFRSRGPGWRNSIRHNLSLNDCFIKSGRSANGKGHYWAVHPANVEDFERGDFRRRRAQRKVRRHMGLSVPDDDDSPSPSPTQPWSLGVDTDRPILDPVRSHGEQKRLDIHGNPSMEGLMLAHTGPTFLPGLRKPSKRRLFDMASLLAPDDDEEEDDLDVKIKKEETPEGFKSTCHDTGREGTEPRCCDSRCMSPHAPQDCASPCSRSGGCCGSEEEDHDNDNEEIEVTSNPNSPVVNIDEPNTPNGTYVNNNRLSVVVSDDAGKDLQLNRAGDSSQVSSGALDLSSPNSSEMGGRSPNSISPYSSRTDPPIEAVPNDQNRSTRADSPLHNSLGESNFSETSLYSIPKQHTLNTSVSRNCNNDNIDSTEEKVEPDIHKFPNGYASEQRSGFGFMPPTSRIGFDVSKLNADHMHYLRLQQQAGPKRAFDLRGLGYDPRFDLKLGLNEAMTTFSGVDLRNHPDSLRPSLPSVGERHPLSSPEAIRLASMGLRWNPAGLLRGNLPPRDHLNMFAGLGARNPNVFSPFQAVNIPLPPQRTTMPSTSLTGNLPTTLQTIPSTSSSSSSSPRPSSSSLAPTSLPAETAVLNSSTFPPSSSEEPGLIVNIPSTCATPDRNSAPHKSGSLVNSN
ncbi:forkhead box q2-like protein [Plakobranchus ocellatus]|uniref:Forkhead box q2-like protein n=1 Tax=Plakobranchus ocellatus TaxID=259542 RepID=A0AAV4CH85_9GAST|nr:forkhead box q2-like protein [Plakobranchus ocellatus]